MGQRASSVLAADPSGGHGSPRLAALLLVLASGCGQASYGRDSAADIGSLDVPLLGADATLPQGFDCMLRDLSEFSPSGKRVLVFCKKGTQTPSRLYRVDPATGLQDGPFITLPGNGASDYVPIDDDTGYVLQHSAGTATSGALYRFNLNDKTHTTLLSGSVPMLFGALDRAGGYLYTNELNLSGAAIRKFNTGTDKPAGATISQGSLTLGQMFLGAGGKRLLVVNSAWELISVFDTSEMRLVANVPVGKTLDKYAAISHDGKTLGVIVIGVGIRLIDVASARVTRTLPFPWVMSLAFSADGKRLYLSSGAVVDVSTGAVVGRMAYRATNLEVSPDGKYLLLEDRDLGGVRVMKLE